MPEPFSSFLNFLAVFSLNISLECYTGQSFFQGVYLSAAAPFVLAMLLCLVSFAAKLGAGGGEKLASRLLLLSYVVLPPTVLKLFQVKNGGRSLFLFTCHCLLSAASRHSHFLFFSFSQALDCVKVAGEWYVRVDTGISCSGSKYAAFAALDAAFIAAYLGIPLLWLVLLWRQRKSLSPPTGDLGLAAYLRGADESLRPLRFLFQDYVPSAYAAEVFEM